MEIAGICLLALSGVLLLISGLYFYACWVFEKLPHKTGKALGRLYDKTYKKDVNVWGGFGKGDGPPRVIYVIKHLTKTKYLYSANKKLYLCTYDFWKKPKKVPNTSWVIYLKAFPRISYLKNEENYIEGFDFSVKAIVLLIISTCTFCLGFTFLSKFGL